MNKYRMCFIVLSGLVCLVTLQSKSQIITTSNIETSIHSFENSIANNYSQKILPYKHKDSSNIVFTRLANNQGRFYMTQKGVTISKYVDIEIGYIVLDFVILCDTLFFCGYNTSSEGFIAYFSISDAFNGNYFDCKYSLVPTILNVRKIKAYQGEQCAIVAGIGSQYYCPPPDWREYDFTVVPCCGGMKKFLPPDPVYSGYWQYHDYNYYDCFFIYQVKESSDAINGDYNDVLIYRHEKPFYNDTIYVPESYKYEEFYDLAITDNFICLATGYNFDSMTTTYIDHCKEIVLHKFDKTTFAQTSIRFPSFYNGKYGDHVYGFCLEALDSNNVAVCYMVCPWNTNSDVSQNLVIELGMDRQVNHIKNYQLIYSGKFYLKDIEYDPKKDYLLVLNNLWDTVESIFYVDVNDDRLNSLIFHQIFNYPSYTVTTKQNIYKWNNLLRYNDSYFVTAGLDKETKHVKLLDKETYNFNSNDCITVSPDEIILDENIGTQSFANLLQCYDWWTIPSNSYPNGYAYPRTNVFKAFINGISTYRDRTNTETNCETLK